MLKTVNPFENFLNKVVDNDKLIIGKSNNWDQNLINLKKSKIYKNLAKSQKSKIHQNLAKSKKSKHYLKLSKKTILDKLKNLLNLIIATNACIIKYSITKTRVAFIQLRQTFIKASIF